MTAHHRLASSDFPMRPPSPCERRQSWDLPSPVRGVSVRARGLRPRRVRAPLALSMRTVLPSTNVHSIGTLESRTISRLHTQPVPRNAGSTLRSGPCGPQRMTRGRCGSLHLHRIRWKRIEGKLLNSFTYFSSQKSHPLLTFQLFRCSAITVSRVRLK